MADIRDAFPSKYLKSNDLKGRPVVVTMRAVAYEPVGNDKEMKPVLYFQGKDKGLVLNKTNTNTIMALTGSPVTEEWDGVAITLYPTETSYAGETVDCIRIKKVLPAAVARRPEPAPEPPAKRMAREQARLDKYGQPQEAESEPNESLADDDSVPF